MNKSIGFSGADVLGGMAGLFGGMSNAVNNQQGGAQQQGAEGGDGQQPAQQAGAPNVPPGVAELLGSLMNLSTSNVSFRREIQYLNYFN